MPSPVVFLIVEDSEQDYQDVQAYVKAVCAIEEQVVKRGYRIERAKNREEAQTKLGDHEVRADPLIAIFDIHIEEQQDDLTDLIVLLLREPLTSWVGTRPIIVYSQYSDRSDLAGKATREKIKAGLFFTASKSPRSGDDPRERLRQAIRSALHTILVSGGQ